jgi:hypothetical protein
MPRAGPGGWTRKRLRYLRLQGGGPSSFRASSPSRWRQLGAACCRSLASGSAALHGSCTSATLPMHPGASGSWPACGPTKRSPARRPPRRRGTTSRRRIGSGACAPLPPSPRGPGTQAVQVLADRVKRPAATRPLRLTVTPREAPPALLHPPPTPLRTSQRPACIPAGCHGGYGRTRISSGRAHQVCWPWKWLG